MDRSMIYLGSAITLFAIGQIVLAIVFYGKAGSASLTNLGWLVMWLSAIFGWLPIFTFRKYGEVGKRGYVHTTRLVDRGLYAIVRHPQYLAGILLNLALILISQHLLVILLGLPAMVLMYIDIQKADQNEIEKFGDAYRDYMDRVPQINFILGIIRQLQNRRKNS